MDPWVGLRVRVFQLDSLRDSSESFVDQLCRRSQTPACDLGDKMLPGKGRVPVFAPDGQRHAPIYSG